jgi:hypothetical protein
MVVILPRVIRRSNPSRRRIGRLYTFFIRHSPWNKCRLQEILNLLEMFVNPPIGGTEKRVWLTFKNCAAGQANLPGRLLVPNAPTTLVIEDQGTAVTVIVLRVIRRSNPSRRRTGRLYTFLISHPSF